MGIQYNSYYHSAHGVMIVYDITDSRSFDNVRNYWMTEIRSHAPQNAVLMLVGNKCDMGAQRAVEFSTAEKFASELGISLFEVSAKTGINVDDAFLELASAMRERLLLSKMGSYCESSDDDEFSSGFHVDGVIGKPKKSSNSTSSNCCGGLLSPTHQNGITQL